MKASLSLVILEDPRRTSVPRPGWGRTAMPCGNSRDAVGCTTSKRVHFRPKRGRCARESPGISYAFLNREVADGCARSADPPAASYGD
jgi:hypothetical protein